MSKCGKTQSREGVALSSGKMRSLFYSRRIWDLYAYRDEFNNLEASSRQRMNDFRGNGVSGVYITSINGTRTHPVKESYCRIAQLGGGPTGKSYRKL